MPDTPATVAAVEGFSDALDSILSPLPAAPAFRAAAPGPVAPPPGAEDGDEGEEEDGGEASSVGSIRVLSLHYGVGGDGPRLEGTLAALGGVPSGAADGTMDEDLLSPEGARAYTAQFGAVAVRGLSPGSSPAGGSLASQPPLPPMPSVAVGSGGQESGVRRRLPTSVPSLSSSVRSEGGASRSTEGRVSSISHGPDAVRLLLERSLLPHGELEMEVGVQAEEEGEREGEDGDGARALDVADLAGSGGRRWLDDLGEGYNPAFTTVQGLTPGYGLRGPPQLGESGMSVATQLLSPPAVGAVVREGAGAHLTVERSLAFAAVGEDSGGGCVDSSPIGLAPSTPFGVGQTPLTSVLGSPIMQGLSPLGSAPMNVTRYGAGLRPSLGGDTATQPGSGAWGAATALSSPSPLGELLEEGEESALGNTTLEGLHGFAEGLADVDRIGMAPLSARAPIPLPQLSPALAAPTPEAADTVGRLERALRAGRAERASDETGGEGRAALAFSGVGAAQYVPPAVLPLPQLQVKASAHRLTLASLRPISLSRSGAGSVLCRLAGPPPSQESAQVPLRNGGTRPLCLSIEISYGLAPLQIGGSALGEAHAVEAGQTCVWPSARTLLLPPGAATSVEVIFDPDRLLAPLLALLPTLPLAPSVNIPVVLTGALRLRLAFDDSLQGGVAVNSIPFMATLAFSLPRPLPSVEAPVAAAPPRLPQSAWPPSSGATVVPVPASDAPSPSLPDLRGPSPRGGEGLRGPSPAFHSVSGRTSPALLGERPDWPAARGGAFGPPPVAPVPLSVGLPPSGPLPGRATQRAHHEPSPLPPAQTSFRTQPPAAAVVAVVPAPLPQQPLVAAAPVPVSAAQPVAQRAASAGQAREDVQEDVRRRRLPNAHRLPVAAPHLALPEAPRVPAHAVLATAPQAPAPARTKPVASAVAPAEAAVSSPVKFVRSLRGPAAPAPAPAPVPVPAVPAAAPATHVRARAGGARVVRSRPGHVGGFSPAPLPASSSSGEGEGEGEGVPQWLPEPAREPVLPAVRSTRIPLSPRLLPGGGGGARPRPVRQPKAVVPPPRAEEEPRVRALDWEGLAAIARRPAAAASAPAPAPKVVTTAPQAAPTQARLDAARAAPLARELKVARPPPSPTKAVLGGPAYSPMANLTRPAARERRETEVGALPLWAVDTGTTAPRPPRPVHPARQPASPLRGPAQTGPASALGRKGSIRAPALLPAPVPGPARWDGRGAPPPAVPGAGGRSGPTSPTSPPHRLTAQGPLLPPRPAPPTTKQAAGRGVRSDVIRTPLALYSPQVVPAMGMGDVLRTLVKSSGRVEESSGAGVAASADVSGVWGGEEGGSDVSFSSQGGREGGLGLSFYSIPPPSPPRTPSRTVLQPPSTSSGTSGHLLLVAALARIRATVGGGAEEPYASDPLTNPALTSLVPPSPPRLPSVGRVLGQVLAGEGPGAGVRPRLPSAPPTPPLLRSLRPQAGPAEAEAYRLRAVLGAQLDALTAGAAQAQAAAQAAATLWEEAEAEAIDRSFDSEQDGGRRLAGTGVAQGHGRSAVRRAAVHAPAPALQPLRVAEEAHPAQRWYVHPSSAVLAVPSLLPERGGGVGAGIRVVNSGPISVCLSVLGPNGVALSVAAAEEEEAGAWAASRGPSVGLLAVLPAPLSSSTSSSSVGRWRGFNDSSASFGDGRAGGTTLVPARGEARIVLRLALPPSGRVLRVGDEGWRYLPSSRVLIGTLVLAGGAEGGGAETYAEVRVSVAHVAWEAAGYAYEESTGSLLPLSSSAAAASPLPRHPMGGHGPTLSRSALGPHTPGGVGPALPLRSAISGLGASREGAESRTLRARQPGSPPHVAHLHPHTPVPPSTMMGSPTSPARPAFVPPQPASPLSAPKVPQGKPVRAGPVEAPHASGLYLGPASEGGTAAGVSSTTLRSLVFPALPTSAPGTSVLRLQVCNRAATPLTAHVTISALGGGPAGPGARAFFIAPAHATFTLQPRKFCLLPVSFAPPPQGGVPGGGVGVSPSGGILYNGLLTIEGGGGGGGAMRMALVGETRDE